MPVLAMLTMLDQGQPPTAAIAIAAAIGVGPPMTVIWLGGIWWPPVTAPADATTGRAFGR